MSDIRLDLNRTVVSRRLQGFIENQLAVSDFGNFYYFADVSTGLGYLHKPVRILKLSKVINAMVYMLNGIHFRRRERRYESKLVGRRKAKWSWYRCVLQPSEPVSEASAGSKG